LSISKFHLNILTANLSAIAVGVGVDYSIHLISGIYYFRKLVLGRRDSVDSALSSVSRPVLANAFGLAIGLSVLFFSPLRIHMQVASVMWVAMVVSSMAALLLIPIFFSRARSRKLKPCSHHQALRTPAKGEGGIAELKAGNSPLLASRRFYLSYLIITFLVSQTRLVHQRVK